MPRISPTYRIINFIIDVLVIKFIVVLIVDIISLKINPLLFDEQSDLKLYLFLRWCACVFGYYFLMEYFTGKSIGKFFTRTRVVELNDGVPKAISILKRTLLRFVPFESFTFFGQNGLHDKSSNTKLINEPKFTFSLLIPSTGKALKYKVNISRKSWIIIGSVAFLFIVTNPSLKAFKEHLGATSYEGMSRQYNFFVCSVYKYGGYKYLGVGENFFEVSSPLPVFYSPSNY